MRRSTAVWLRELPDIDGVVALGFRDLMELRFVDAFRKHKVSWSVIRRAAELASELLHSSHPFSARAFKTDGKSIFAEVIEESGEAHLIDLVKSQYAFARILQPYLFRGLDFANDDSIVRWWPLGHQRNVMLDPKVCFGRPVESRSNVPTSALWDAYCVEKSVTKVAAWFEVDVKAVRDAVLYEKKMAA